MAFCARGGVDTTNGRIDHLELYNVAVLGDVQGVWICERRITYEIPPSNVVIQGGVVLVPGEYLVTD